MERAEQFDVALSFAGENRAYVRQVAAVLEKAGVKVFFDDFEQTQMWGQDLAVHLDEVYRQRARFVVPFISRHYAEKAWPKHEFQSALARAVEAREPFLLPVRFDNTELPGLRSTIHYLSASELRPEAIAAAILEKLGKPPEVKAAPTPVHLPSKPPSDFNPYAESEAVLERLRQDLEANGEKLRQSGYGLHSRQSNERWTFRVMHHGRTLYSLDVWIGHEWGENTLCFYGAAGGSSSPGATNAHGSIVWDKQRGAPAVKLANMSLLSEMEREYIVTAHELADMIWTELVRVLDASDA